ncbi:MAG: calcium/sodium antiporter [bacterium]|nr:calcium/sodium antiporter [bacterium]
MLISILLMTIGFVLLVKGADLLVDGSSSVAKRFNIPEIVIGLTVVAFGTSTPELVVSIMSDIRGYNEIVLGNVIGSNLFNILVVLGISGLIFPLTIQRNTVWKEIPCSLAAAIILLILGNDIFLFNGQQNILSTVDGILLLVLFFVFILYIFVFSKTNITNQFSVTLYPPLKTAIFIIAGFAGLFLGGKLVIDNAIEIAHKFSLSEKFIGLTIIAAGTSLPELATSAVAAYKKRFDISVGNIIGSNIFNIFLVLGISASIKEIPYNQVLNFDVGLLILATMVLFLTMFSGKKRRLDRWESLLLILTYIAYLVYLFIRK